MSDIFYDRKTQDITLNDNGDLQFTSDVARYESIRQDCEARLLTFAGEYFLDDSNTVGVKWVRDVFQQSPANYSKADDLVRLTLSQVNGIAEVVEITYDLAKADRQLTIKWTATTTDGARIQSNIGVG